jgi:hypothetical protein
VQSQPNYRKYTSATIDRGTSALGAAGARLLTIAVKDWRTNGGPEN